MSHRLPLHPASTLQLHTWTYLPPSPATLPQLSSICIASTMLPAPFLLLLPPDVDVDHDKEREREGAPQGGDHRLTESWGAGAAERRHEPGWGDRHSNGTGEGAGGRADGGGGQAGRK